MECYVLNEMKNSRNGTLSMAQSRSSKEKHATKTEWISKLPFFTTLTESQQQTFLSGVSIRNYEKADEIFNSCDPHFGLIFVISGQVGLVMQSAEGAQLTIKRVGSGDEILCLAYAHTNSDQYFVQCISETASTIASISTKTLTTFMNTNKVIQDFCSTKGYDALNELLGLIDQLAFYDLKSRLLRELDHYCLIQGKKEVCVTHEALANDLGTSREVISRLLKQLAKEECIELGRKRIRVH